MAERRPLERLLAVQDLDTELSQTRHRRATLPGRQALDRANEALALVEREIGKVRAERDVLDTRQAELDEQTGALARRREAIEERMRTDRSLAPRDLQAMDQETRHLSARRAELEEVELGVFEEQEVLDASLEPLEFEESERRTEIAQLNVEVAELERTIDEELAALEAERSRQAGQLPDELAKRYEAIRARSGGTGAARLVGNRCGGCHLELPSVELERVRRLPESEVATCDQCGRILVVVD